MEKPVAFAKLNIRERQDVGFIARRWVAMARRDGDEASAGGRRSCEMDLAAVHATLRLDFAGLAVASDFDLAHDVGGIRHHLNRTTGELEGHFLPRYLARRGGSR